MRVGRWKSKSGAKIYAHARISTVFPDWSHRGVSVDCQCISCDKMYRDILVKKCLCTFYRERPGLTLTSGQTWMQLHHEQNWFLLSWTMWNEHPKPVNKTQTETKEESVTLFCFLAPSCHGCGCCGDKATRIFGPGKIDSRKEVSFG